jgi:hypothetical protein
MSNKHPAKDKVKPPRKPVDGEDGFSGSVFEQRKKVWNERDNPDLSQGKTHERNTLWRPKP